jgi:hypothetical protein
MPPFEPGRVLPTPLRDELDLTEEQDRQVDDLEREVKARLMKIFTPEQKKKLKELNRRRPPGPPPGMPGRRFERDGRRGPGGPPPGGPDRRSERYDRFDPPNPPGPPGEDR